MPVAGAGPTAALATEFTLIIIVFNIFLSKPQQAEPLWLPPDILAQVPPLEKVACRGLYCLEKTPPQDQAPIVRAPPAGSCWRPGAT